MGENEKFKTNLRHFATKVKETGRLHRALNSTRLNSFARVSVHNGKPSGMGYNDARFWKSQRLREVSTTVMPARIAIVGRS